VAEVETALRLAEESARLGRAQDGLKEAAMYACVAAGHAQLIAYPDLLARAGNDEPNPPGPEEGLYASLAVKPAEMAARAAYARPEESASTAWEAWGFARDALNAAELTDEIDRLEEILDRLLRAALKGGWTDRTPVPVAILDALPERSQSARPWWRLW
jgi:hypothetical protein